MIISQIAAILFMSTPLFCEIDKFMPTECEICGLTVLEFQNYAERVHKRLPSEFADITEKICQGFNEFKIHKEKIGLNRFSRAQSKTIETLKQMRNKGVKVELGMPYEMWDQPSAEIYALRQGCESLLEHYEDLIEEWFLKKSNEQDLFEKLCIQKYLKNKDFTCFAVNRGNNEL